MERIVGMEILQIKEDTALNDISQIINSLELILFRLTVNTNWPVVYMTENIKRLGYRSSDFTAGKLLYESIIHSDDRDRVLSELLQAVEIGEKSLRREYRIVTYDGETRWVEEQLCFIKDSGGQTVFLQGGLIDITERKERDSKLEYISFHDTLTGLYNRAFFEEEVSRLDLSRYSHVGIIVCDVDGLKLINDILGHKAGDKLIITAASILKKAFRQGDLVARIGGDEFAIILPNVSSGAIEAACTKLRASIKQYNQGSREIPLSISIGYAVSEKQTNSSFQELFNLADQNMYSEKMRNKAVNKRTAICRLLQLTGDKDFGTGHTIRLQELVVDFGNYIGLSKQELRQVTLLASYHDIGKIAISENILFKPAELSKTEKLEVQRHCEVGYRMALSVPELASIADLVLKHHEWWNGQGYPLGLKKNEIPLECRIFAIVDAYDAITTPRPYRKVQNHQQAVDELRRSAGKQFDTQLVETFADHLISKNVPHCI